MGLRIRSRGIPTPQLLAWRSPLVVPTGLLGAFGVLFPCYLSSRFFRRRVPPRVRRTPGVFLLEVQVVIPSSTFQGKRLTLEPQRQLHPPRSSRVRHWPTEGGLVSCVVSTVAVRRPLRLPAGPATWRIPQHRQLGRARPQARHQGISAMPLPEVSWAQRQGVALCLGIAGRLGPPPGLGTSSHITGRAPVGALVCRVTE